MTLEQLADSVKLEARLDRDDFIRNDGTINLSGQSHWTVKLTHNGRCYSAEWHQGSAHRVWNKGINDPPLRVAKGDSVNLNVRITLWMESKLKESTAPKVPDLLDVLYCLVSDAQSAEYNIFDDWCAEYGYSNDSISARKAYDACCETRAALNGMFNLDELYELFQDY